MSRREGGRGGIREKVKKQEGGREEMRRKYGGGTGDGIIRYVRYENL